MADWAEREPGFAAAAHELARVLRRARGRLLLVLLLAAAVTAVVVYRQHSKQPLYKATVVLRMTEGGMSIRTGAFRKGDLHEQVNEVVFSRDRLYSVMEELELYPAERARGEDWAMEAIGDDLGVAVYNNYFLYSPDSMQEVRSVRIAISYVSLDPQHSTRVAVRLSDMVLDHFQTDRTESLAQAVAAIERDIAATMARMDGIESEIAALAVEAVGASEVRAAAINAQMLRLRHQVTEQQTIVNDSRNKLGALSLQGAAPVNIEVAQVREPPLIRQSPLLLGILGLLCFLAGAPLIAIVIGAFDNRVYDSDDVARLGLPIVGHVPGYRGDDSGCLNDRLGTPRGQRLRQMFGR